MRDLQNFMAWSLTFDFRKFEIQSEVDSNWWTLLDPSPSFSLPCYPHLLLLPSQLWRSLDVIIFHLRTTWPSSHARPKSKKDNSFVSLKGHDCFPSGTVSISSTVLKMEVLFLHSVVIEIQTWSDYSIGLVSPKFPFICSFPLPFFFVPLQFYLLE